jgi:hypothetical protein
MWNKRLFEALDDHRSLFDLEIRVLLQEQVAQQPHFAFRTLKHQASCNR